MNLPATMRAFIDITVAAMACDQTRVVLISNFLSDNSYDYSCPYAPVNAPDAAHHALSHGGTNTNPDQSANQNGWLLERQFQHQMMAELAKKLKDIPEGTGTMLDNTVILHSLRGGGAAHPLPCGAAVDHGRRQEPGHQDGSVPSRRAEPGELRHPQYRRADAAALRGAPPGNGATRPDVRRGARVRLGTAAGVPRVTRDEELDGWSPSSAGW